MARQCGSIGCSWRKEWIASIQCFIAYVLGLAGVLVAQQSQLGKAVQPYVKISSPRVVLEHVRVIDGTGKPPAEDQNIVIEGGKITAVQHGADVQTSPNQTVLDLHGYTVLPGLVGMHDHMYYIARPNYAADGKFEPPLMVPQMTSRRHGSIWPLV